MGLLALLAEGPAHGYGLKAEFEARTGGVWKVNVGQVYTTLDRLHADGMVEPLDDVQDPGDQPQGARDRRTWQITPAGKAELEDWFDSAAELEAPPPRDELLVKVLMAFGRSAGEALAVIDRQRSELYRLAQAHRRARARTDRATPDGASPPPLAHELHRMAADLMAEAVAARHEADLRWLDHCETSVLSRIDRRRQP